LITVPLGGTNAAENALTAVQSGDNIFIWTGGGYNIVTYIGPNWDGAGHAWADQNSAGIASPVLVPGQAIFYQNGQSSPETNTFVGNVVLSNSVALPGNNNFSLVGSTPPIGDTLDGTNLALPFQSGDNVFLWTGGGYNIVTYIGPNWDGAGHAFADQNSVGIASPTVSVGQGFFYQNGQGTSETWNQNLATP
jgi:hypothetical protein